MEYAAKFVDINGRSAKMRFHANNDLDAAIVANALAAKSNASWVGLQKFESITVDSGVYTNYQDAAKPVAGSTVRSQGVLHYAVQSRQQELKVTIPAVQEAVLSSSSPTTGTDPANGVGRLVDEEGVAVSGFNRGKFQWGKRKGK